MHFFRYALNYEGNWLPVQLLTSSALLLIWLSILFAGVNLLYRSFGPPRRINDGNPGVAGKAEFQRYSIAARLYHWGGSLFLILVLLVSGIALFAPGSV